MGGLAVLALPAPLLALLLVILALGLTAGEWRAAGHGAVGVARESVRGGRGAVGFMARMAAFGAGLARMVGAPVGRFLEPRGEPELPPLCRSIRG